MAKEHKIVYQINWIGVVLYLICQLQNNGVSGTDMDVSFSSRILGGFDVIRGDWPFIAALYRAKTSQYFCGGTIISNQHILTAANCIQEKGSGQKLSPDDIIVRLGAHNLTNEREEGAVQMNVKKIYVHPDWRVYTDPFDADIAILALNDEITFTDYIEPVSLPTDNVNLKDATGTIVGWGLSEDKFYEEIPRQAEIRALNDSYCYRTDSSALTISSSRTFCGRYDDATPGTPNIGDSGGGFFVYTSPNFKQYGVISASSTDGRGRIVLNSTSVYSNVQFFKSWIDEILQIKDEIIVDLNCTYRVIATGNRYACCLHGLNSQTQDLNVKSIKGVHLIGKAAEDVDMIFFSEGTMFYIPNGIGKTLKNLRKLQVEHCLSTKLVTRSNFEHMERLVEINFYKNEIGEVKLDALWDLPNLEILRLVHNELKQLDPRTFEKNYRLQRVYLQSNRLEFLPRNMFRYNNQLERVDVSKNTLKTIEIDFSVLTSIQKIVLDGNTCINAYYVSVKLDRQGYENSNFNKKFKNLSAFQRYINGNCSSSSTYAFHRVGGNRQSVGRLN